MHYLLIIAHDDVFQPSASLIEAIQKWTSDMDEQGIRVQGNPLKPAGDATTVRIRNGKQQISPGPFSNSQEQMCAYELIECASEKQAIQVAASHPMASAATIEVRPVWSALKA